MPDLPFRLHPGVQCARDRRCISGELGAFRGLRLEFPSADDGTDLVRVVVPRAVDVVRALIGEIEALTATGDPPGEHPDLELVVQLRAADATPGRAAHLVRPPREPARLTLVGGERVADSRVRPPPASNRRA